MLPARACWRPDIWARVTTFEDEPERRRPLTRAEHWRVIIRHNFKGFLDMMIFQREVEDLWHLFLQAYGISGMGLERWVERIDIDIGTAEIRETVFASRH
jgi:hypothetical protein